MKQSIRCNGINIFNPEYFKIAKNVHVLNQYLLSENKKMSVESIYSRLFFDLLGRHIKWCKDLTNAKGLQLSLVKLAKKISIKKDISNCVHRYQYLKILSRIVFSFIKRLFSEGNVKCLIKNL